MFDSSILAGLEYHQQLLNKASKSSNLVSWSKSKGKKLLRNGCNFSDNEDKASSSSISLPPKPYPRKESAKPQQHLTHNHSDLICNKRKKLKKGWRRFCCGL